MVSVPCPGRVAYESRLLIEGVPSIHSIETADVCIRLRRGQSPTGRPAKQGVNERCRSTQMHLPSIDTCGHRRFQDYKRDDGIAPFCTVLSRQEFLLQILGHLTQCCLEGTVVQAQNSCRFGAIEHVLSLINLFLDAGISFGRDQPGEGLVDGLDAISLFDKSKSNKIRHTKT